MAKAAVVVFAGVPVTPTPRLVARLRSLSQPYVVAADSGAATALAFGLRPDVIVGDFDSLDTRTLDDLKANKLEIQVFPKEKDATDGELALMRALQQEPSELLLVGFLGGPRFDQTVTNLLLAAQHNAILLDEYNETTFLTGPGQRAWQAERDEIISLVPFLGDARGISTTNMRYQLRNEDLPLGTSRGVSNEPIDENVAVQLEQGTLLVVRHFPGG